MINSQTTLDLLRDSISVPTDQLKSEQEQADPRLETLENRLREQERRLQEQECQIDWLVRKFDQLEYVFGRNQELEFRVNTYSLDGDANCDF
jgi:uncharacterized protein (DUF3084 family)